jgi:hypothetical protein
LKESGQLENDASVIFGFYWPFGVEQIPGKFVPDANRPLSFSEWQENNALTIPVDNTGVLPVFSELQLVLLKNRMGVQDAIVRLGLAPSFHDVFDPYVAPDWLQQQLPKALPPLPNFTDVAPKQTFTVEDYFTPSALEAVRQSLPQAFLEMQSLSEVNKPDNFVREVVQQAGKPTKLDFSLDVDDLV